MSESHNTSELQGLEEEGAVAIHDLQSRLAESQRALNQARLELAHFARVASAGMLTAAIAHEVNQPLSGILTNAGTCLRILAGDAPDLDRARETARRTIRDCNRATEVITRLRRLFAKNDLAAEPVDLGQVAREVIVLTGFELDRNEVAVTLELGSEGQVVTGDHVQLQQVVLNLVLNACEAMKEVDHRHRTLKIRTECPSAQVAQLSVSDVGSGLDAQAADRIFQPFFTTKPSGMGIGLSISKSIVESHGGRLWGSSNIDGPGATFFMVLPCARNS